MKKRFRIWQDSYSGGLEVTELARQLLAMLYTWYHTVKDTHWKTPTDTYTNIYTDTHKHTNTYRYAQIYTLVKKQNIDVWKYTYIKINKINIYIKIIKIKTSFLSRYAQLRHFVAKIYDFALIKSFWGFSGLIDSPTSYATLPETNSNSQKKIFIFETDRIRKILFFPKALLREASY